MLRPSFCISLFFSLRSFAFSTPLRYLFLGFPRSFSFYFFLLLANKKTFAPLSEKFTPTPVDARLSSAHNAPTLQTGNRSSPEKSSSPPEKISATHPVQLN